MKDGQRAQSTVEFALVAPIFFAVLFGIIACGILLFQASAISDAAQSGARQAIVEFYQNPLVSGCEPGVPAASGSGPATYLPKVVQHAANIVQVDSHRLCQQGSSSTPNSFCPSGNAGTLVQAPIAGSGDAMIKLCAIGGFTTASGPSAFKVQVTFVAHPLEPLLGAQVDLKSTSILAAQP
ncbi:MAG: TadE family protein [Candidatus Dormibacteria bacterium]